MLKNYLFFYIFLLSFAYSLDNCSISNCQTCSLQNSTCLECVEGYYYDREQEICLYLYPCNLGEYKSPADGKCQECSADCETCFGPENYHCYSCLKGSFLVKYLNYRKCFSCPSSFCDDCDKVGDCISCGKGYWLNDTSGDCSPCTVRDCNKCEKDPDVCEDCKYGFFSKNVTKLNDTCETAKCALGSYPDIYDPYCKKCDASCRNCFDSKNSDCYECAYGYFFNNISQCVACNETCGDCEFDAEFCVGCKGNTTLKGHDCVDRCAADEYVDEKEGKCKKCSGSCGTCLGSPDYCLECADKVNFNLTNHTCQPFCEKGKYVNMDIYQYDTYYKQLIMQLIYDNYTSISFNFPKSCASCSSSCVNCIFDKTSCTECPIGKSLYNDHCLDTCPAGTYKKLDFSSNTLYCLACAYPCQACENLTYCSKCQTPFSALSGVCYYNKTKVGMCDASEFSLDRFCVERCPDSSVPEGHVCKCDESCPRCSFNMTNLDRIDCYLCEDPAKYSYKGRCMDYCPSTTWIYDENAIIDDNHDPFRPDGDRGGRNLLGLAKPKTKYCYDDCPAGFLRSFTNNTRICLRNCPAGTTTYQGTCLLSSCPEGFYLNPSNTSAFDLNYDNYTINDYFSFFCSKCDVSCRFCNGPTANNCTGCYAGKFLQSNDSSLNTEQIKDLYTTSLSGISQLSNKILNHYTSFGAFCDYPCPVGLIPYNQICLICFQNCDECANPLIKLQDNCVVSCPVTSSFNETLNECILNANETSSSFTLELSIKNTWNDKIHASYINDAIGEIGISGIYGENGNSAKIISINCSLEFLNFLGRSESLFIRNFGYSFISYDFFISSQLLASSSQYNVICSVQLENPDILLDKTVYFETFPRPNGTFLVSPIEGISLKDNFTAEYSSWFISGFNSENFYLKYDIWLILSESSLCLSQNADENQGLSLSESFYFPYSAESINATLQLHVYNDFTEVRVSQGITILPNNDSNSSVSAIIDFSTISPGYLSIILNGFTKQNAEITDKTAANLQGNNEYLYKSINNEYAYKCDDYTDCNGHGLCLTSIVDPKKKCNCDTGFSGFDCSWKSENLEETRDLFTKIVDYLEGKTANSSENYQTFNDILSNLALFPDVYNGSLLSKSLNLSMFLASKSLSQNDTIRTINTLNNYLNVLKVLRADLSQDSFKEITDIMKEILENAVESIGFTFSESSQSLLTINTENIKVKLESLRFLGEINGEITSNFTVFMNDSDEDYAKATNSAIEIKMGKDSAARVNYFCNTLYTKTVVWSSAVFAEKDDESRYFTDVFSFEIKNRKYYSSVKFANDTTFSIKIPKIARIMSSASNSEAKSLYNCLYYDNTTNIWESTGVNFASEADSYIECVSEHLTDFSVQLTPNDQVIYQYFSSWEGWNEEKKGDGRNLAIIFAFHFVLSLLLFWVILVLYKKKYKAVSSFDNSRNIIMINPLQIEIKQGKEGTTVVEPVLEMAKDPEMYGFYSYFIFPQIYRFFRFF